MNVPSHYRRAFSVLLAFGTLGSTTLSAQQTQSLRGRVVDASTGAGVSEVAVSLEGQPRAVGSAADGTFTLTDVPVGEVVLLFRHIAYGTHRHPVELQEGVTVELYVRLTAEAIELEPVVVEAETTRDRAERASGASVHIVERDRIERALGTSRHLGELVTQTIPGMHLRRNNSLSMVDVCLEFRAAASLSLMGSGCRSPQVFLDGVPVSSPDALYGMLSLHTIQRMQVIPPGEAGARYGTGSLYGVLLIETMTPGPLSLIDGGSLPRPGDRGYQPRTPRTFDWAQDPAGPNKSRTMLGAFLGNAVGLAAGVLIARQCIGIDDKDEIVTSCSAAGNIGAGAAAFALPALGGAYGARLGGVTVTSRGQLGPALIGAAMMLFPGYTFAMSTEGGEAEALNVIGQAMLVLGVPALVSIADRLFRKLR